MYGPSDIVGLQGGDDFLSSLHNKITRHINLLTFLGIIVIILMSFAFLFDFTVKSSELTEDANKTQLGEIAMQTSNLVETKINDLLCFVQCAAETFSDYEDLISDESFDRLRIINKSGSFDRVRVVLPDGRSYDENGECVDVSERYYLVNALNGNSGISNLLDSIYNTEKIIIFYTPIYQNGSVIGVLTGVYEAKSLSTAINMSSFGGHGYASIVEANGDVIISPGKNDLSENKTYNVWEKLSNAEFSNGYNLDSIRTGVKNGESGITEYTLDGKKRYTYFMPIRNSDNLTQDSEWYVMQTIPETVMKIQTGYINEISTALLLKVIVLFIVVFAFSWYYNAAAKKSVSYAKQQLDSVVNTVPGGVAKCSVSDGYPFLFVSEGFLKMIGSKQEDFSDSSKNSLITHIHPDDRKEVEKALQNQNIGQIEELKYRIGDSSGNTIWVLNKCMRTIDKHENTACLYCACIDITDEMKLNQDLLLSNERFKMVMQQTSNIVFEYDSETDRIHFITKSNSYYRLPRVIDNGPFYFIENGIVFVEFAEHFLNCFKSMSRAETNMVSMILKLRRADGKAVWNRLTISAINDPSGKSYHSIGTFEDIHQTKEAQMRQRREEKYRAAMLSDTIATYEINLTKDKYIKINSSETILKTLSIHDTYSNNLNKICNTLIYPDDRTLFLSVYEKDKIIESYNSGRIILYQEYRHIDEDGQPFWISSTTNLMSDPENGDIKAFSYIKDIDRQKNIELSIKRNSERDSLTDLYNRKAAMNLISEYLRDPENSSKRGAFISIDLDCFKNINDKYGHMVGDELLNKVSISFRTVFDGSDIVARMGGDEFIVFMKNAGKRVDILAKALEASRSISKLSIEDKKDICITTSMGIALSPIHGSSFEELYRNSDKALYHAKRTGKDRCVFYDEGMG